ncbi:MAG: FtsW/RodA/SpoVE family cell cycle protein [Christensenellales bacterium]
MILERRGAGALLALIIMFSLSASFLLAFKNDGFDIGMALFGLGFAFLILISYNLAALIFRHIDRITLVICYFLTSIGLVTLARLNIDIAVRQLIWLALGTVVLFITVVVIKRASDFGRLNYLLMAAVLGLLISTLLFARTIGGARNWVYIGQFSFQPSEIAKVMFIIVSAYFFAERRPAPAIVCYAVFTALCVFTLVLSNDLGGALLYAGTFLVMFFAGTGRTFLTFAGLGVLSAGAFASYHLFSHVRTRVEIWQNPWMYHRTQGYQIVQGLMAIASGGLFGAGLGLGYPDAIPVNTSDFIFAVICEEFGIIFGIVTILAYLVFIIRGLIIALNAETRFDALLVFGATCMLSLQSFIIIGGVIKLIPLTGITLPFISAGGTSLVASLALVGIIEGVAVKNGERDEYEIVRAGGEVV